jgi:hypothetical protein
MATITLEYNSRDIRAKKTLEHILSTGVFKSVPVNQSNRSVKKSRLEQSLEDVDKGNVFFLAGPTKL